MSSAEIQDSDVPSTYTMNGSLLSNVGSPATAASSSCGFSAAEQKKRHTKAATSTSPTGSISTARACGNPQTGPKGLSPWRCEHAATLGHAKGVAHKPTADQHETKKDFKPRFNVDHAASPMPDTSEPERLAPCATSNRKGGRDHLGIPGEIKSEYLDEIIGIGTPAPPKPCSHSFSLTPFPQGEAGSVVETMLSRSGIGV